MYVVLWEFLVRAGSELEFENLYDAEGEWVSLFRRAPGFLGTELLRDGRRYVTIDYWQSPEVYQAFREGFAQEWESIDARGEAMTEEENHVGSFIAVSTARSSLPV